jgi:hypothetical protein
VALSRPFLLLGLAAGGAVALGLGGCSQPKEPSPSTLIIVDVSEAPADADIEVTIRNQGEVLFTDSMSSGETKAFSAHTRGVVSVRIGNVCTLTAMPDTKHGIRASLNGTTCSI